MKREIRARPVDLWRRLTIVHVVDEAEEQESGLERNVSLGSMSGIERSASAANLERAGSTAIARPKAEIPTPIVETVADYEATVTATFQLPKSYIRTKKIPLLLQENEAVEYNLDHDDEDWIKNHRMLGPKGEMAGALDNEKMERMIDELEKATGTGDVISASMAENTLERKLNLQPFGSDMRVVQEVYQYWIGKRHRLKKPLLRRFWPVTSINDTNPHLVFRPREKERLYKLRRHNRKNDMDSFRKMQTLRRDFDRLREILELVKRRERLKLILVQLEEQKFLQSIAELTGQERKPVIPKEGPLREDLKIKIRVRAAPSLADERQRKRRYRDEADVPLPVDGIAHRRNATDSNTEADRLKRPVGNGLKEKEQALPTPDYVPSFMEEYRYRQSGRAPNLKPVPYANDMATYAWRPAPHRARGRGGRIGHIRSGVCTSPRCPPIEYSEDDTIRYRCRPRIGRGGRLIIDRVPMMQLQDNALAEDGMDVDDDAQPAPDVQVVLAGGTRLRYLEKYPTLDLMHADVFKYPLRYLEILEQDDAEDELLLPDESAPTMAEPLVGMPNRPPPAEADAVVISRFAMRL